MQAPLSPTRRQIVAGIAGGILAPLVPLNLSASVAPPSPRASRSLMGTQVTITLEQPASAAAQQAIDQAFATMERLASLMSRFDSNSQVSRINLLAGKGSLQVAPELFAILQQAQAVHQRTQGAFTPTLGQLTPKQTGSIQVPSDAFVKAALPHTPINHLHLAQNGRKVWLDDSQTQLDLGGIAKLPILQAGLETLKRQGIQGAMINGGGDIVCSARSDGKPWRIGVRDAANPTQLLAVLPLQSGIAASSGDYERFVMYQGQKYHHIVSPKTGRPTQGIHGVTLVANHPDEVNGLGTAAMVVGSHNALPALQKWDVAKALVMHSNGQVQATAALRSTLLPPPNATAIRGLA